MPCHPECLVSLDVVICCERYINRDILQGAFSALDILIYYLPVLQAESLPRRIIFISSLFSLFFSDTSPNTLLTPEASATSLAQLGEPIAVVGSSCRFPGESSSPLSCGNSFGNLETS
jgi:hypothetical protein